MAVSDLNTSQLYFQWTKNICT